MLPILQSWVYPVATDQPHGRHLRGTANLIAVGNPDVKQVRERSHDAADVLEHTGSAVTPVGGGGSRTASRASDCSDSSLRKTGVLMDQCPNKASTNRDSCRGSCESTELHRLTGYSASGGNTAAGLSSTSSAWTAGQELRARGLRELRTGACLSRRGRSVTPQLCW